LLDPHITNNLQDNFWRVSTTACYIFAATLHTWRPFLHPETEDARDVTTGIHLACGVKN